MVEIELKLHNIQKRIRFKYWRNQTDLQSQIVKNAVQCLI